MGKTRWDSSALREGRIRGWRREEFVSPHFGANAEPLVQCPSLAQPSLPQVPILGDQVTGTTNPLILSLVTFLSFTYNSNEFYTVTTSN